MGYLGSNLPNAHCLNVVPQSPSPPPRSSSLSSSSWLNRVLQTSSTHCFIFNPDAYIHSINEILTATIDITYSYTIHTHTTTTIAQKSIQKKKKLGYLVRHGLVLFWGDIVCPLGPPSVVVCASLVPSHRDPPFVFRHGDCTDPHPRVLQTPLPV